MTTIFQCVTRTKEFTKIAGFDTVATSPRLGRVGSTFQAYHRTRKILYLRRVSLNGGVS